LTNDSKKILSTYDLSIVIPVYNESWRIDEGLRAIMKYLNARTDKCQIVVVDDGSGDDTVEKARKILKAFPDHLVIESEINRGKGHAVKIGMLAAGGAVRLFTDIDLSVPIETADHFARLIFDGADIVIGTRKVKGSDVRVHQPWWREMPGGVFRWMSKCLCAPTITDFTCGFKAFSAPATRAIFEQSVIDRWSFDAEILFLAYQLRLLIVQIPVVWVNSEDSRVSIGIDMIRSFLELMIIPIMGVRGQYKLRSGI